MVGTSGKRRPWNTEDIELKEKIKGRAEKAWAAPSEHHHRITDITPNSLIYRLPSGNQDYSGVRLLVKKDSIGRVRLFYRDN